MNRPMDAVMRGDCVMLPSPASAKIWLERKRVTPGASRLMAMPATM